MVVGTGADENWVIEFHCGVHHVRKDRSTQSSDILPVRISRSKPTRQGGFQYGRIALGPGKCPLIAWTRSGEFVRSAAQSSGRRSKPVGRQCGRELGPLDHVPWVV